MDIKSLHHVAYRCKDAKQTVDFYTRVLDLEYAMAMSEDRVPSTGEFSPYIEDVGPTDHTISKTIYFFDPNGHRLELAVDTTTPEMKKRLADVSDEMLKEWSKTKKAPHHADWVHKR